MEIPFDDIEPSGTRFENKEMVCTVSQNSQNGKWGYEVRLKGMRNSCGYSCVLWGKDYRSKEKAKAECADDLESWTERLLEGVK